MMRDAAAVLLGGAVGTALRLGIDGLIPDPWATLGINLLGAFTLGLLVGRLWSRAASWLKAGLGAGLLGSFTTFSALAVALVGDAARGHWLDAALYLAASVALGLLAAWLGLRLGRPGQAQTIDLVDE